MSVPRTRAANPLEFKAGQTRAELSQQYRDTGSAQADLSNTVPFIPCKVFTAIQFKPGTATHIAHGLSHVPNGYLLVNIRIDHTQAAATAAQGAQRNDATSEPGLDETKILSLGPWQPFLADVLVW